MPAIAAAKPSSAAAVQAPRLHHQWLPDVLDLEPRLHRDLREPLTMFGHKIQERTGNAVTQAVSRGSDGLRAGSDVTAQLHEHG